MTDMPVLLIGCGRMGMLHLERWRQIAGVRVASVCDAMGDRALRAADAVGAVAHTEWREALDAGGAAIVDICVPPTEHASIACEALTRGAHVLCEKPLARTAEEARAMVDAAARSGRLLMPAFCHRFHPPILFAGELIANDDLGRIVMFRARFSSLLSGVGETWLADPVAAGGGVLLNLAIHAIDLFRHLVGEVRSASGRLSSFLPGLRVEDSAAILLESLSGAIGVIEASWATPGGRNVLEIYGTAGACIVDYDDDRTRYRTADMVVWETRAAEGPDRYYRELQHFADAVRGYSALQVTGEDGLRANEIVADLYASSSQHSAGA